MNKSIMTICDKKLCIGCGICENVCKAEACKLLYDEEGFLYPLVDDSKCVNCNLCKNKCPALSITTLVSKQDCYAYYTKDIVLRKNSSSGGFFTDIASYIINEKHGVVAGAAYTCQDENTHYLKHIIVDNINDLTKMRGSKYVQSDTRDIFKLIKTYLDGNRVVLFVGTPCQVSAIKSFVGENQNLYTVDLFCHGIPSPQLFYKYLKEMKAKNDTYVNFKDKTIGWNDSCISYDTDTFKYKVRHSQDTYYLGFIENLYLRRSCHVCKYNKLENRPGDISIGDFWDIEKIMPEFNDDIGVNAVVINTDKGDSVLEKLKETAGCCRKVEVNSIIAGNGVLVSPVTPHRNREKFFNDYRISNKFLESTRKNLNIGNNVLLLNHSFSQNNYGAMMVAYSMERIVEKLGYTPKTLLFKNSEHTEIFDSFKKRYLNTTDEYEMSDYGSLLKLNKSYKTFITGSDQVWRNWWYNNALYRWFIDFADGSKNLISYAASFGFDYFDDTGISKKRIEKLLKGYTGISVREKSGIDICKQNFNTDATWVIDPTQLLEAEDYDKIIEGDNAEVPCKEPYLAYMIFPEDDNATEATYFFINKIATELNLKVVPLLTNKGEKQKTIGEWLSTIKNAKFIITESFHGTMFSLIFKTPMLILALDATERNRLPSFFDRIGILQNRIIYSLDEEKALEIAKEEIDWNEVYKRRKVFQEESLDFLRTAMSKPVVSNGRTNGVSLSILNMIIKTKLKKMLPSFVKKSLKKIYYRLKK